MVVILWRGAPTATLEIEESIPGDLFGKPDATLAEDAAVPIQKNLGGEPHRLLVNALGAVETRIGLALGHCLVLQWAFAALIADWAIERVVDEQELHHAGLSLERNRRGVLRVDNHSWADFDGA